MFKGSSGKLNNNQKLEEVKMKTFPNGCKASIRELKKIEEERRQISIGCRRLHSPEVNSICRREVKRWLELQSFGVWQPKEYVLEAVQQDLGFTDAQIETQLKNLTKTGCAEKKLEKVENHWENLYRATTVISHRQFVKTK
jgi:hypothetical protein